MNKEVWNGVNERSGGICEECGRPYPNKHHAFNGPLRKKMEMVETVFDLCHECHQGNMGVHSNKRLALKYKRKASENLINAGWTIERIIKEVGKWYGE